ncbi:ribulose-phosphate 3-epimerase [Fidelibacter multiformis]|uniref:ribulose-phosphate 3-epimerase n=1 Tax=Fidelibacter multiformis TaxID=3377529 RepID=UPI0037DC8DCB
MKKLLAPSLLSADFLHLEDQIRLTEEAGADILHLDIMDGHYVPNLTFGPPLIEKIRQLTDLPLDVHLMITNPEETIDMYIDAGADWISVHPETVRHLHRLISHIKDQNVKAGVVLNPATPVSCLQDILPVLDYVLLMSVNPGFGGQHFIPDVLKKVDAFLRLREQQACPQVKLEMDGGINRANIAEISKAGVEIFVAGSAIYHSENIAETILFMKKTL